MVAIGAGARMLSPTPYGYSVSRMSCTCGAHNNKLASASASLAMGRFQFWICEYVIDTPTSIFQQSHRPSTDQQKRSQHWQLCVREKSGTA